MENLDYEQLIKERKLYYVKYGRGAILGVSWESLDEGNPDVINVLIGDHGEDHPVLIDSIYFLDDEVTFQFVTSVSTNSSYKVTKKIPLSQITFEQYELI